MIDFDGLNASFNLLKALLMAALIAVIGLFMFGVFYNDRIQACLA